MKENGIHSNAEHGNEKKLNIKEPLLIIEYNSIGRFGALMFRIIVIVFGLFLAILDNYYINIIGTILILLGVVSFIDILLFKKFSFYSKKKLQKEWYIFGYKEVSKSNLNIFKRNSYFGGKISFWNKQSTIFERIFFSIDILPISKETIKEIKNVLIKFELIKGDEYEWID